MPQETNRLHKQTAVAAAATLCLSNLIDLYNYSQHPSFPNPWYQCTILIPIALDFLLGAFLFRHKKDIATGCVFLLQIIYPIFIAPVFQILWIATDHVIVGSDDLNWLHMLLMLMGSAYLILMALDCFLSSKQALRKVRIAFLILPVVSAVCNTLWTFISYQEVGIPLNASTMFDLIVHFTIFSYSPTILPGLSFFLSYRSNPALEETEQL